VVETRTEGTDNTPRQLIRYQLGNHLGSASLELDDQAQIISYEEYTPYGSTSYQAVSNQIETPKRYRYTGMERDEESGLAYHTSRYYAPWIGRWTSPDLIARGGRNLYSYCDLNPITKLDTNGQETEYCFWPPGCGEFAPAEFVKDVAFGTAEGVYDTGKNLKENIEYLANDAPVDLLNFMSLDPKEQERVVRKGLEGYFGSLLEKEAAFQEAIDRGDIRSAARIAAGFYSSVALNVAISRLGGYVFGLIDDAIPISSTTPALRGRIGGGTGGERPPSPRAGPTSGGGVRGTGGERPPSPRAGRGGVRPTLAPTIEETGLGGIKATWGKDPRAMAKFEPAEGGAVHVTDLFRGAQPKGSGGIMLADALKAAKLPRPTIIRGLGITNKPTVEALAAGKPASSTVIGETLRTTAKELGATIVKWNTGKSGGKPYIEIRLAYPEQ
jgi:RHS repeat-associated protein